MVTKAGRGDVKLTELSVLRAAVAELWTSHINCSARFVSALDPSDSRDDETSKRLTSIDQVLLGVVQVILQHLVDSNGEAEPIDEALLDRPDLRFVRQEYLDPAVPVDDFGAYDTEDEYLHYAVLLRSTWVDILGSLSCDDRLARADTRQALKRTMNNVVRAAVLPWEAQSPRRDLGSVSQDSLGDVELTPTTVSSPVRRSPGTRISIPRRSPPSPARAHVPQGGVDADVQRLADALARNARIREENRTHIEAALRLLHQGQAEVDASVKVSEEMLRSAHRPSSGDDEASRQASDRSLEHERRVEEESKRQEAESRLMAAEARIRELEGEVARSERARRDLKSDLKRSEAAQRELQVQLERSEAARQDMEEDLAQVEEARRELERDFAELEDEKAELNQALDGMQDLVADLQDEMRT